LVEQHYDQMWLVEEWLVVEQWLVVEHSYHMEKWLVVEQLMEELENSNLMLKEELENSNLMLVEGHQLMLEVEVQQEAMVGL